MLVATAITLLMMAAIVNLFANLTGGIRNRRAVIELSGQLRQARQRLSLDLAGATCPAVPWQRHGDDVGYLEIIEGVYSDANPSALLVDVTGDGVPDGIDVMTSTLPSSQLIDAEAGQRTDGRSLGDYDDVLALTVRSDDEKFVAQVGGNRVESRLAEVIWFAIENPDNGLLGEPGMRRIYRRALIIAPWLNPINGPPDSQWFFQRYDISAHYDPARNAWIPNTLGDLTRRENRCYRQSGQGPVSPFPHMLATGGAGYSGSSANVTINRTALDEASGNATAQGIVENGSVVRYVVTGGGGYDDMPSAVVNGPALQATARPVLAQVSKAPNPLWQVAQITFGPAPFSIHRVANSSGGGSYIVDRTGEDLMLADALAFDVRVYDPSALIYHSALSDQGTAYVAVQPGDPGWQAQFQLGQAPSEFGAYVDLGWLTHAANPPQAYNRLAQQFSPALWPGLPIPLFHVPRQAGFHPIHTPLNDSTQNLYPFGFPAEYDTWSLHYESDGIDQDGVLGPDQGTNGLDDDNANGVDDVAERETSPPYDTPLRGVQVRLRVYERDARQIRETSVTRNLVP